MHTRYTSVQALSHPWIASAAESVTKNHIETSLIHLRTFNARRKLVKWMNVVRVLKNLELSSRTGSAGKDAALLDVTENVATSGDMVVGNGVCVEISSHTTPTSMSIDMNEEETAVTSISSKRRSLSPLNAADSSDAVDRNDVDDDMDSSSSCSSDLHINPTKRSKL